MSHLDSPLISQPLSAPIPSQSFETSCQDPPLWSDTLRHFPEGNSGTIQSLLEPCSKGRSRHAHSLRQIANGIRFLLNSHDELTICDLSNLIYELVCQTQLGSAIAKGHKLNAKELQKIRRRYTHVSYCRQSTLIRNVRRRLYDVLNVMISASIVKRHGGKVRLAEQPFVNFTGIFQPNDRERFQLLKQQAQAKLEKLKVKRQLLEQTARDFLMMKKMSQRNGSIEMKDDQRVKFPLLVLSCDSNHTLAFSEETVNVKSDKVFGIWTEMNLIEKIWPVSVKEARQFLNPQ